MQLDQQQDKDSMDKIEQLKGMKIAAEAMILYARRIAKMLEVKTIKGSVVIAKMAGILSTANIISVDSTTIKATKSGVAALTSIRRIKNLSPSN